ELAPSPPEPAFQAKVPLYCALFSPDGEHVFAGGADSTLLMWEVAGGKFVRQFPVPGAARLHGLALAPNHQHLMSWGVGQQPHIWDIASGKLVTIFGNPVSWPYAAAFEPQGRQVLLARGDIALWDIQANGEVRRF